MKRVVLLLTLAAMSPMAFADKHPKLAPELKKGQPNAGTLDVIVQFRPSAENGAIKSKIVGKGGTVKDELSPIHALHASFPASHILDLENDKDVTYISPNRPLKTLLNNSAGAVNANYAWSLGLDGSGVGVAILDSGIHVATDLQNSGSKKLSNSVVANFDLIGGGADDKFGHGTHVAGILAGNGAGSNCPTCDVHFRGIASGAYLINFRVLDQNGQGTDATVITAINKAISLKNIYNIRVLNLSLGRPAFESYKQDPLCQAVEAAWNAGIVVVVAAGNDGPTIPRGRMVTEPLLLRETIRMSLL
jgi:serine protease AprX